ncbi:MAG: Na/Pi symporter [Candidatus Krumholzibacteriota bacterium]|nr:Na/Pi symporter [Candidatus Krumholzibacteriota bacterium]
MDPEPSRTTRPSPAPPASRGREALTLVGNLVLFLAILYVFFVAIKLMGDGAKSLGSGFVEQFLGEGASSAILGLLLGVFTTSLVQSSSTVTSMIVCFVASGAFGLRTAIPIIMGANIGTTVTNTIVSLGYISRRRDFRRAFGAGILHDIFNVLAVLVLFPLEQTTHVLERSALWLSDLLVGQSLGEFEGLKRLIDPVIHAVRRLVPGDGLVLLLSLLLLFASLALLVKLLRSVMLNRIAHLVEGVLFRNAATSMTLGFAVTILVQSSSVTTSLVVPLVGAGILRLGQIFPYLLGSNVGTTVTALLAALAFAATGSAVDAARAALGVTAALVHTLFNVLGIVIWYPLRRVPINLARRVAYAASRSRRRVVIFVLGYFAMYLIPLVLLLLLR